MEEEILNKLTCILIFIHQVNDMSREKYLSPLPLSMIFQIFSSGIPFSLTALLNFSMFSKSILSPEPVKSPCRKQNC